MNTTNILEKMITFSKGNRQDINHFMSVYSYALAIAKGEQVEQDILDIIEVVSITHDIACPLCREKYGNTNGSLQEKEGAALVKEFLKEFDLPTNFIERISYLIGHHHTFNKIDGIDYQILVEADYLVNAYEKNYSLLNVQNVINRIFKTKTGLAILKSTYQLNK